MGKSKIDVSILILNYNGKNLTDKLLNSIKKLRSKYKSEIIVVDNASTDNSLEFIKKKHKNVKLVVNKENRIYSGINSGLKFCKGKYILFLNNDMELDRDCIKNLVNTIESDKDIAMVAPKLVNHYHRKLKSGGTWVSRTFYNGHIQGNGKDNQKEIPYLGVGLIRKDFVDVFGYLFDPDYLIYAEDLDLGLRIRLYNKKMIFCPNAIMRHMHAVTMKKKGKAFSTFLLERNSLMTFFKILSIKNLIIFSPYVLIMRLFAILKDFITLDIENAFSRIKAILWVIFNINLIYQKRKKIQKLRKANDDYILKIFSEKYLFKKKFIV
jgi:GT2 family glycosyltransferase